jgi:hypothetical protein
MGIGSKPVRVLSERIMSRGFEPTVVRLMEQVCVCVCVYALWEWEARHGRPGAAFSGGSAADAGLDARS